MSGDAGRKIITSLPERVEPPADVVLPDGGRFAFAQHLTYEYGMPTADWNAVSAWVNSQSSAQLQATAWSACERAWLEHLLCALSPDYRLDEDGDSVMLSSLEQNVARAALEYMNKTEQHIKHVLDGIAVVPEWGRNILIVFDDSPKYYDYVARYYPSPSEEGHPEGGLFAFSSGMHINHGCSHFVTMKADLLAIQPVIAHEMTHGCVSHLPLPAWLNEGIAVNTEQRLCGQPPSLYTPYQMHEKHLQFWGDEEIQQFWSGKSFLRDDQGNMLSYDLARIIVEQFSKDWETFRRFVLAANAADAGAAAAREFLGVDLGTVAGVLLRRDADADAQLLAAWSPTPALWNEAPERGAF